MNKYPYIVIPENYVNMLYLKEFYTNSSNFEKLVIYKNDLFYQEDSIWIRLSNEINFYYNDKLINLILLQELQYQYTENFNYCKNTIPVILTKASNMQFGNGQANCFRAKEQILNFVNLDINLMKEDDSIIKLTTLHEFCHILIYNNEKKTRISNNDSILNTYIFNTIDFFMFLILFFQKEQFLSYILKNYRLEIECDQFAYYNSSDQEYHSYIKTRKYNKYSITHPSDSLRLNLVEESNISDLMFIIAIIKDLIKNKYIIPLLKKCLNYYFFVVLSFNNQELKNDIKTNIL